MFWYHEHIGAIIDKTNKFVGKKARLRVDSNEIANRRIKWHTIFKKYGLFWSQTCLWLGDEVQRNVAHDARKLEV